MKKVLLKDICENIQYGYTASAENEEVGPKFLRITDIVPDIIDWESVPYCKIEEKEFDKYMLQDGDIVIARTGATTGYAKYLKTPPKSIFASYLVRLKIKKGIDKCFIGYIIQSQSYKDFIKRTWGGSAQPNANAQVLTSFPILLPDITIQRKIAAILSAYDDLIENNTRRIKILEEMAQRIYKEWFIDFKFPCLPSDYMPYGADKPGDLIKKIRSVCVYPAVGGLPLPQKGKWFVYVLLCADGSFYIGMTDDLYHRWYEHVTGHGAKWTRSYKPIKVIHYEELSSRQEAAQREQWLKTGFGRKWLKREYDKLLRHEKGLPAPECQLRQAGKFVNSELGKIPEGWEVKRLDRYVDFIRGVEPGSDNYEKFANKDNIPFIRVGDLGNRSIEIYVNRSLTKDKIINEDDIVVSMDGTPGIVKMGLFGCYSTGIRKLVIRDNVMKKSFLYFLMMSEHIQNIIKAHSKGTTILHASEAIKYMNFILPNNDVMKVFDDVVSPMIREILMFNKQNKLLRQTRDLLLPKLISGELDVSDLDIAIRDQEE